MGWVRVRPGPVLLCVAAMVAAGLTYASMPAAVAAGAAADLNLGSAADFLVLAQSRVTNTGPTIVSGDLGVGAGGAIVGFPPGQIGGQQHSGGLSTERALAAAESASVQGAALAPDESVPGDVDGRTFNPGTYHSSAALELTTTMTLDAGGDPNAVFIFQVDAAMNAAAGARVELVNHAQAAHVYWVVRDAAVLGAGSHFAGSILAGGAITTGEGAKIVGRALSQAAITLANNTYTVTDVIAPVVTIDGGPRGFSAQNTVELSGTLTTSFTADTTVKVTIAGQVMTTTVRNGNGRWNVTTGYIEDGTYSLVASVTDRDGNKASARQVFTAGRNAGIIPLGTAATYSVLGQDGVTNTEETALSGDLGAGAGALIIGFPPGHANGSTDRGNAKALKALDDMNLAYRDAEARTSTDEFAGDQNGVTMTPGIHHTSEAFALTGTLTLDARDDPGAVFVFQIGAALNTAAASRIVLVNGALASHVFWQANGAVSTGADSTFVGTILGSAAVNIGARSTMVGRVLAAGLVTLGFNRIVNPPPDPPQLPTGSLSIDVPGSADLGSIADSVNGDFVDGQLGEVRVTDTRAHPTAAGWIASVTCTAFQSAGGGPSIAASNVSYSTGAMDRSGSGTPTAYHSQDLTTPKHAASISGSAGSNVTLWNPTITIYVRGGLPATTYTTTVTHSVA